MMGYWGYGWNHMGPQLFGGAISLVVWVAVIALVVAMMRRGFRGRDFMDRGEKTALDILRERYAKGEIGKEEFLEKKKDLES